MPMRPDDTPSTLRDRFYTILRDISSADLQEKQKTRREQGDALSNFESQIPDLLRSVLETTKLSIQASVYEDDSGYLPVVAMYHGDRTAAPGNIYLAYIIDPNAEIVSLTLVNSPDLDMLDQVKQSEDSLQSGSTYRDDIPVSDKFKGSNNSSREIGQSTNPLINGILFEKTYSIEEFPAADQFISDLLHFSMAYQYYVQDTRHDQRIWVIDKDDADIETWTTSSIPHAALTQQLGERREQTESDTTGAPRTEDSLEARAAEFHTKVRPGDIILACDESSKTTLHAVGKVRTPPYYDTPEEVSVNYRSFNVETDWVEPVWVNGYQVDLPSWEPGSFTQMDIKGLVELLQKIARSGEVSSLAPYLEIVSGEHFSNVSNPVNAVTPNSELEPYYWISIEPEDTTEPFGDHLKAECSTLPEEDLACLSPDDTVFIYTDGAIVGYSEITSSAYPVIRESDEKDGKPELWVRIDRDNTPLEEEVAFSEIFSKLLELREDTAHYPVKKSGLDTGYLHRLNESSGEYLLEKCDGREPLPKQRDRLSELLTQPKSTIESTPKQLYFQDQTETRLLHEINTALASGKHLILSGPPGTGKTKLAKYICRQVRASSSLVDDFRFTTATAEWTTFDTVGGYMPDGQSEGSSLTFRPRLFLNCLRDQEEIRNDWLIVDELNRANIDKALGPLFSALSEDSVTLPYQRDSEVSIDWVDKSTNSNERDAIADNPDRFPMTPAWRLIGTMNTIDKTSLYDLSFAFMRRFTFVHVSVPDLRIEDGDDTIVKGHQFLIPPSLSEVEENSSDLAGENYAWVWVREMEDSAERQKFRETLEYWHEYLGTLWTIVNEYRTIGPALIRDIAIQLHNADVDDETAFTSAITTLVFPQLEGLRERHQQELIEALTNTYELAGDETDSIRLQNRISMSYLRKEAKEIFNWQDLDV